MLIDDMTNALNIKEKETFELTKELALEECYSIDEVQDLTFEQFLEFKKKKEQEND